MQKTGRSDLPYLRGHLAFTSESRYVEFCGGKNDYKSARRGLNQDQKGQRERESWQQPLIFTRLEKHIGRTGHLDNSYICQVKKQAKHVGHLLGGSGEGGSAIESSGASAAAETGDHRCQACGARGSAPMAALRKGGRDRVWGQRERQLNLGLVQGVQVNTSVCVSAHTRMPMFSFIYQFKCNLKN